MQLQSQDTGGDEVKIKDSRAVFVPLTTCNQKVPGAVVGHSQYLSNDNRALESES